MHLFFREMKANYKSLIGWSLIAILFIIIGMQKYSNFLVDEKSISEMLSILDKMPKFLQSMWGLNTIDITNPLGYYSILFSYLIVLGAIYSSSMGVNIVYKEERDKTSEFLLTKPILRRKILTSKILLGIINTIIFAIISILASYVVLQGLNAKDVLMPLFIALLVMIILGIIFMLLGVMMAVITKNGKNANSYVLILILAMYILGIMSDISDKLLFLKTISLFSYFPVSDIVSTKFNIINGLLVLIMMTLSLIISYKKYKTKEFFN